MSKVLARKLIIAILTGLYFQVAFSSRGEVVSGSDSNIGKGKDTVDTTAVGILTKADNLIQQALDVPERSSSDSDRMSLLTQAINLIRSVPPDQAVYQGHRKKAILQIKAALQEMKQNGSKRTFINQYMHKADSELRYAILLKTKTSPTP